MESSYESARRRFGYRRAKARQTIAALIASVLLSAVPLSHSRASRADIITIAAVGSLDTTFGNGGKVVTDWFGGEDDPLATVIQPDGKVIVAGTCQNGNVFAFALARYLPNGNLDASFGAGGKVYTPQINGTISRVVLQPDGKIVAAGAVVKPDPNIADFALARYLPDGSLDASFGTGGKVTTDFFGFFDNVSGLALLKDGRILAAGIVQHDANNASSDFGMVRYTADGSLDTSFGTDGKVTTDFFGKADTVEGIAIQSDGRVVAAGASTNAQGQSLISLARYNMDGNLDTSFGVGGKATTAMGDFAAANGLAIQADGKVVVGGYMLPAAGGTFDSALVRYNADGSLDITFGSAGKVTTDFFGNNEFVSALLIQPDGKLLAAGRTAHSNDNSSVDFALARYLPDGSLDASFGTGGKTTTDFFGNGDFTTSAVIQPDGNIVVAGIIKHNADSISKDFGLARYVGDSPAANLPVIQSVMIQGKKLIVSGHTFDIGAAILVDGQKQKKTANDEQSPDSKLIAKKAGNAIAPGQTVTIQVRNTDGQVSAPLSFTRP
ncbi:MAG TPA: delta-60 repeat domain-containing protein [Blastocatellia bacterium]|nr:delta-60 repeat domain-containing protein [Blastocatellia bacterium]